MTLLVAEVSANAVWMIADTAITNPGTSLRDQQKFHPKIEVLGGGSLVGFAGDVHHGQRIMRSVSVLQPGAAVLNALLAGHRDYPSVDFAYACLDETGCPRLFRIAKGQVECVPTLYLGSQDAFGAFQRIRHAVEIDHAPQALHMLMTGCREAVEVPRGVHAAISSMFSLFATTSNRDVGGWPTPYILTANGAELCSYAYSVSDPILSRLAPGSIIPHGTAEEGGFAVSMTELRERDGIVLYWLQRPGGKILLRTENGYDEWDFEGPPIAFKEAVRARLGRDVQTWFSDQLAGRPVSVRLLRDAMQRPRVAVAEAADGTLSFAWVQRTEEPFTASATLEHFPISLGHTLRR